MGTLFNQPVRALKSVSNEHLDDFLTEAARLAAKHGVQVSDVVAAKHALEMVRTNDLYVANANVFDEHIAGVGEILNSLVGELNDLGSALHKITNQ